jgi:hypothetical protein
MIVLAGPTVLSAVGVNPPHDGVRRRWRFNVAIAVALSDARKESVELTIAIVPAGTSFPAVGRNSVMPSLGSNLLRRPVEFGSVDPHAMQNDRELTCDRNLGLAEPIALGELHPPSLHGGPFRDAGQQNAGCFK